MMMIRHELACYWIEPECRRHSWPRAESSAAPLSAGRHQPVHLKSLRQGHRERLWHDELSLDRIAAMQADIASSRQTAPSALLDRTHRARERRTECPQVLE